MIQNTNYMETLLTFWHKRCKPIDEQAQAYLAAHNRIRHHARDALIKAVDEQLPYLCIVLSGLVGGYQTNRQRQRVLRELALPMDFFTGTRHTFSSNRRAMEFVALKQTKVLLIPIAEAREGQGRYVEISELFHILKQRKILRLRKLVELYQETDRYTRYELLWELLPELAGSPLLTNTTCAELLQMSLSHLKRIKKKYLLKK